MKKIKEYQMMLNENRIPYLETQKSFLCESKCNSPANVAKIMESCFQISDLPEEHIYAIALNTKNQITGIFEVGKGTVNCSLISAREILIRMLLAGAVSFILCHNHPSGDTNPSPVPRRYSNYRKYWKSGKFDWRFTTGSFDYR